MIEEIGQSLGCRGGGEARKRYFQPTTNN